MSRQGRYGLVAAILGALVAAAAGAVTATAAEPYRTVWDDFRSGFSADGPTAKWFYFRVGTYAGDDGITTTSDRGLRVISSGTNAATGKPAFVRTLAQEEENGGLPGGLDHVKWLVFMNHNASSGFPGFDAEPGQELACETSVSGRTYGTSGHPFGQHVQDPDDDLRLASLAMNMVDFETFMVFDFFVTNKRLYAFYERLPFGRVRLPFEPSPFPPVRLGNYAAFSYAKPVGRRRPREAHRLKIAYDRAAGIVRWLVDGEEVHRVDRIGFRLPRATMILDTGGEEMPAAPRQLECGMGMFSVLDASGPSGQGLVRLSSADNFYFDPRSGEPVPEEFFDDQSQEPNRLFGQGAELRLRPYVVSSQPVESRDRRPRIRLSVSPRRVRTGERVEFRFRATMRRSARRPVRGAAIRFAGRTGRTNRKGRARIVRRFTRPGRYRASAAKEGLRRGEAFVRVR